MVQNLKATKGEAVKSLSLSPEPALQFSFSEQRRFPGFCVSFGWYFIYASDERPVRPVRGDHLNEQQAEGSPFTLLF